MDIMENLEMLETFLKELTCASIRNFLDYNRKNIKNSHNQCD